MNTILVYPDLAYSELQRPAPPYSVLFIADALQRAGVEVSVFDLRYDSAEAVVRAVTTYAPDYVGLSVMTGPQIRSALTVAAAIRKAAPATRLVWGGIHPTILPAETLRHPYVDLVIRGDGEQAYRQLVQGMAWPRIPGLAFFHNERICDNGLAPPTKMTSVSVPWDLVDARRYVVRGRTSIVTSRGCPYRCAFCYNAMLCQPWRGWTIQQCMTEFDRLVAFGAKDLLFFDDAFFTDYARVRNLLPYFRREGLLWTAELRVDQLSQTLAREIHEAGCQRLFFGAESGSPRMLRLLNKRITVSQLLRSAVITRDAGIRADYSWMVGIPTETPVDRHATIAAIKRMAQLNPAAEFAIKIYTPYPGTPLYRLALNERQRMPDSLTGWSRLSRFEAPASLPGARQLETLALTSAIIGREVMQAMAGPPGAFLQTLARFRWRYEAFGLPFESVAYHAITSFLERRQAGRLAKARFSGARPFAPSRLEETFAR